MVAGPTRVPKVSPLVSLSHRWQDSCCICRGRCEWMAWMTCSNRCDLMDVTNSTALPTIESQLPRWPCQARNSGSAYARQLNGSGTRSSKLSCCFAGKQDTSALMTSTEPAGPVWCSERPPSQRNTDLERLMPSRWSTDAQPRHSLDLAAL